MCLIFKLKCDCKIMKSYFFAITQILGFTGKLFFLSHNYDSLMDKSYICLPKLKISHYYNS